MRSECIDWFDIECRRLFGWHSLLQIPQLQSVVLGGCDQHWLGRVEAQSSDAIEMAS